MAAMWVWYAQTGPPSPAPPLRQQILTDPHAPGQFRADTVRNIDAWYKTFPIAPTDKLYLEPKDRVRIW